MDLKFDPRILGPDEERSDWWQSLSNRFADMELRGGHL